ncbi:MAG: hypothetical protein QXU40_03240, partial [Candidatus Pacearchaeota archaeon]
YYEDNVTYSVALGGIDLICMSYPVENTQDPTQCTPLPRIPYSVLRQQGYDEFFVRAGKVFPYRSTLCADIQLPEKSKEWMIECLRRNGIDPESLPPLNPPPHRLPPPPPGGATEYISVLDGKRFSLEGKISYPFMQFPRMRRALGLRISSAGLQSLETSLQSYINTILNPVANCKCNQRLGNDTCVECCNWNGACCVNDPVSGSCLAYCCLNWCAAGQCAPGSGAGGPPSPCPGGVACPSAACAPSEYMCQDIPLFADCSSKDSMICGSTDGSCDMVGGFNSCGQHNCVYIPPLGLQVGDCANFNTFSCTPAPDPDNNCGNDGLYIDIAGAPVRLETFTRIANYVANITGCPYGCPNQNCCNTGQTELTCSSNCGTSQTCSCRCCSGSQAGCGLINWPPGCPCCDDDMRLSVNFSGGLAVYNIAFLLYGEAGSPYSTACGIQAANWKTSYPGEWLNLCACVQDATLGSYNAEVCRGGFCGFLMELLIDLGIQDIKCTVVGQINSILGGGLKSLMGVLPISAMESLGACGTNQYNLGIYPEFCAGRSLGYSWNYSNGGAGAVFFMDLGIQITSPDVCVIGACPPYPTQVPLSICGNTSTATNVHNCLPNNNLYDVGVFVQQEAINELLYLAWTQGYLCQSFNIPPEVAKVIIPGVRQIFPSSTTVRAELRPVCTSPTPTFQTGAGSSFTINIPEFRVRFTATPSVGPSQDLFDLQVAATIGGQLGYTTSSCHPLDTLCASNPMFRCRRCTGVGSCTTDLIPYGPGWLQITNFSADPSVFGVVSLHPQINLTPPYTEIGDLIGNLLGGLLDQAALRTRIFDLIVVPLRLQSLINFGFFNNALVATLDLPDPFCLNFILDFGNFGPNLQMLRMMVENGYWPISVSPASYTLENKEITEEEYENILKEFRKDKEENKIRTFISVYETDQGGTRLGTYAENSKFVDIKVPFSSKGVKIKLKAEFDGFFPDGSSEVKFAWKRRNGYFWNKIDGDEFYFKPLTRYEEIELFAFLKLKSEPGELPKELIVAYDKFPAVLRVKKGTLESEIVGPDKVKSAQMIWFEVRPDVDGLYYSIDGGNTWSERIEGSRFSVVFPEHLTFAELQVLTEKGDEMGFSTKLVRLEKSEKKGCGSLFGLEKIFGFLFGYVFFLYSRKKRTNERKRE